MVLWPRKKTVTRSAAALQVAVTETSARVILPKELTKSPAKKIAKRRLAAGKLRVAPAVKRRFEGYLQKSRKCWAWKGSHTADGYAQFWLNDAKVVKAHRFAYEIYMRQLSKRERLRNCCGNKQCVSPQCWQPFVMGSRKVLNKAKS